MAAGKNIKSINQPFRYVLLDMSDYFTCSFPEFLPFCAQLYDFSTFKDFGTSSQA
jgi:hypothetical protein